VDYARTGLPPCLVLFDPGAPMEGGELLLAERGAGAALERTPMVLLGVAPDSEIAGATASADCLLKPIDLGLLLAVVQRYCRPASRPPGTNGDHDRGLSVG